MEDVIAKRLRSEVQIKRARVLPYKLMMAYAMAGDRVPGKVRSALQDAMEIATQNVPHLKGNIAVCPDVSGSMPKIHRWTRDQEILAANRIPLSLIAL